MKLPKRGDVSIHYMVLLALGIIVLIVVALIFYYGSFDFSEKVKTLLAEIWGMKPSMK